VVFVSRKGGVDYSPSTVVATSVAAPLTIDGDLSDWQHLASTWTQIRKGAAVMTDASSTGPTLHSLFYPSPKPDEGSFELRGKGFCGNGVLQAGCSLFPSTGFAVLRERPDERGHAPPDATCATLNFGPYGGGHGHPDRLSLVLYADGKHWIPDFGSCGYDSKEKGTWTAQTVSHNTVVVDGISQCPTGEGNPTWPCDSSDRQARAFLNFFQCSDLMQPVSARCDSVYDGVRLERTLCLIEGTLFDFYQVKSGAEHQYDYTLHVDGSLTDNSLALTPKEGSLGLKCGYQHIDRVRQGGADAEWTATWGDERGRLRISACGAKGTEVIVGEGITSSLSRKMPVLILRRHSKETLYAVALQPTRGDEIPASLRWIDTRQKEVVACHLTCRMGTPSWSSTGAAKRQWWRGSARRRDSP
jgi:hypothetical protein